MQISLTATGGLTRRLEVAVPAQRVETEVTQRLQHLTRTARLKGFRPGKIPLPVVQKQFGEQVRAEVLGDLMRQTFAEAVTQEKLKPAAGPRIEPLAVESGADLKYAATFEVLPEIRIKPLDALKIDKPIATITETDVDAMLENMRKQRPNFAAVDRGARDTDRVTIDYHMHAHDGADHAHSHDHDIHFVVGSDRVMPELNEAVKGLKAGDARAVTLPLEKERTAEMHFTVKKVEEQTLPTVDEEFAQAFVKEGGLAALRTQVHESMAQELQSLTQERLRGAVRDALYRDNPIELPRTLVDAEAEHLQLDMGRRMGAKDTSQLPAREPFEEAAKRRVALGLLLGELIRSENLKADRARVLARLNEMAAGHPNAEEVRRTYLQNAEALRQIESMVLEEQTLDWVIERAQIVEKPMSFSELTGIGQNAGSES